MSLFTLPFAPVRGALLAGLCTLVLLAASDPALSQAGPVPEAVNAARQSTFRISHDFDGSRYSAGSGFAVTPDTIVTNAHVVEGVEGDLAPYGARPNFVAIDSNGDPIQVVSYQAFPLIDLAVLRVARNDLVPVSILDAPLNIGQEVWAMGYPGVGDLLSPSRTAQVTFGVVQSYEEFSNPPRYGSTRLIRHNAEINHGNSGGPLLNRCGQVVGVNTLGREEAGATKYSVNSQELVVHLGLQRRPIRPSNVVDACRSGGGVEPWMIGAGMGLVLAAVGGGAVAYRRRAPSPAGGSSGPGPAASGAAGRRAEKPARDPMLVLQVAAQDGTGPVDLKAPIRPDRPVTIGRADNNDIVLAFSTVSRNHLKIEMIGASLLVTDLGSANGTLIDGREIAPRTPRSIPPDTPIEIGTLRARIRLE